MTFPIQEYAAPTAPLPATAQPVIVEPDPSGESRPKRIVMFCLALLVTLGFFFSVSSFEVTAHGGVDQNGYLVGGRMLAETLTMRYAPRRLDAQNEFDPHRFIGLMWVGIRTGDTNSPAPRIDGYYPKYPIGYPLMIAAALWTGGMNSYGPTIAYWINPVCATLAILGTYLLARTVVGTFPALLATLVTATSPTMMQLAHNPNSHGTAVFFVVWGMFFLLRWWKLAANESRETLASPILPSAFRLHPSSFWFVPVRGLAAGFFLGYAATIRYSEATLILPILLATLFCFQWRRPRTWWRSALPLVGWLLPVGLLAVYNLAAMGTLTGYDPTNESSGFRWDYFADNWDNMLRSLGGYGLFYVFPLAIAGLIWMFWTDWRLAAVLAAWILPCTLCYTFYYWAPDGSSTSYLRFFLTIIPGLAITAVWLLDHLAQTLAHRTSKHGPVDSSTTSNSERSWNHYKSATVVFSLLISIIGGTLLTAYVAGRLDQADNAVTPLPAWRPTLVAGLHLLRPTTPLNEHLFTFRDVAARWSLAAAIGCALTALVTAALRGPSSFARIAAGAVVAFSVAVQADTCGYENQFDGGNGQFTRLQLADAGSHVLAAVPSRSVLFCRDTNIDCYLQFERDYDIYTGESFDKNWVNGQRTGAPTDGDPILIDAARRQGVYESLKDASQKDLDDQQVRLVQAALDQNRRVFYLSVRRDDRRDRNGQNNQKDQNDPRRFLPDPFASPEQRKQFQRPARQQLVHYRPLARPRARQT